MRKHFSEFVNNILNKSKVIYEYYILKISLVIERQRHYS